MILLYARVARLDGLEWLSLTLAVHGYCTRFSILISRDR